jgi:hypothetical protein
MAVDMAPGSNRMQRRALWSALGLVLMLCAWFAARGDEDATNDIAHPLTHAASGVPSAARSISSGTDPMRERRIVASIGLALSASSARADFPALTDIGRRGWANAEPPVAGAAASSSAVAAVAPAAFPYQWVGLWTQPDNGLDSTETQTNMQSLTQQGTQPSKQSTQQATKQATPEPIAVIAGPHSTWMVKQGDLLDEDWKIASISATQLQVIYLPSMARETISMSKQ